MKFSVLIGSILALALCHPASAGDAKAASQESPAECRDTNSFVLPDIPWMGKFAYKILIKATKGRPETVKIETVRGPDRHSNRTVTEALQKHIQKNYVCEGDASEHEFYMVLNFMHEVPALAQKTDAQRAASEATMASLHAAAAASAATAKAADIPAGTLVPMVSAAMVCTAMGRPSAPRVWAVGTILLHVVAEVTDGKVTLVDVKMKRGSDEPSLNRKFIDMVDRTMRDTYQCPGNHIFEQEFQFEMS